MRPLFCYLLITMLAGCAQDEFQDLREFVRTSGEGMRGKVNPPPEARPYEMASYQNGDNLPDPFKPRKLSPAQGGHAGLNEPDLTRNHEMLEEFPLESLKMVGFVHLRGVANAVVRSPDGRVHHVHSGNYLGQNFGQITGITETEIRLREMVQDGNGDWSERKSTLQLVE